MPGETESVLERRARHAKIKLFEKMAGEPWFRRIDIVPDATYGLCIKVFVAEVTREVWTEIPAQVDGIKVFVTTTSEQRAK